MLRVKIKALCMPCKHFNSVLCSSYSHHPPPLDSTVSISQIYAIINHTITIKNRHYLGAGGWNSYSDHHACVDSLISDKIYYKPKLVKETATDISYPLKQNNSRTKSSSSKHISTKHRGTQFHRRFSIRNSRALDTNMFCFLFQEKYKGHELYC